MRGRPITKNTKTQRSQRTAGFIKQGTKLTENGRPIKLAKGVYRWLVWGNGFMALSAAGWVVAAQRYLGLPADPVLVALAFGLAVAFYTRDRLDRGEQTRD